MTQQTVGFKSTEEMVDAVQKATKSTYLYLNNFSMYDDQEMLIGTYFYDGKGMVWFNPAPYYPCCEDRDSCLIGSVHCDECITTHREV